MDLLPVLNDLPRTFGILSLSIELMDEEGGVIHAQDVK